MRASSSKKCPIRAAFYNGLMSRRLAIALLSLSAFAQDPGEVQNPFWRTLVMGTHGMVAAEHPLEARAGLRVLEQGGNAFDAAVAVFYTTGVVEQHQSGIGGDAYILAYAAKQKRVVFINGTGPAPKLATLERYRKEGGIPSNGILANTVPGAVGGFDLALRKYGSRKYSQSLTEAIGTARDGHPLTYWCASNHRAAVVKLTPYPSSMKALLKNGGPFEPGAGTYLSNRISPRALRPSPTMEQKPSSAANLRT